MATGKFLIKSGLLILAVNNGTKKLELLLGSDKCYTFTVKLGETTPTYDAGTNF
jgi:tRNA U55 pseudouridine synthase TruB